MISHEQVIVDSTHVKWGDTIIVATSDSKGYLSPLRISEDCDMTLVVIIHGS